jgi:predicted DNA-binding transcriptional regulator AlpA
MPLQNGGLYPHDAESSLMTQRIRLQEGNLTPANGTHTGQLFLTAAEAAALLRLSPITLSRWRIQGYGPRWIKLGPKRVAYSVDDLMAWANTQKRSSTSDQ